MIEQPIAFILASTAHGTMIVNRLDYCTRPDKAEPGEAQTFGVGHTLLTTGTYEPNQSALVTRLLQRRREHFGAGVVLFDVGANVGLHTVAWARAMTGLGRVAAFEPQPWLFYALCGNIVISNCKNAKPYNIALGYQRQTIQVPELNFWSPASYGSVELSGHEAKREKVGQDLRSLRTVSIEEHRLDGINPYRLDFLKIDAEGMESLILKGGKDTITNHKPIVMAEGIKDRDQSIPGIMHGFGYTNVPLIIDGDYLFVHPKDPLSSEMSIQLR